LNEAKQLSLLKAGQFMTGSTDMAAALMSCGVQPSEAKPVTNTYTKDRPFKPGQPGQVIYHLKATSDTFKTEKGQPLTAEALGAAFESPDANEKLDELISKIEDEELRSKIETQLPLAIMSHHRAAFGNRSIIRKWWRHVEPWVFIQRGKKKFLLPRKAKKTADKWGLNDD